MFNLQFTEVVIILVLALIFIGPEKLPKLAKNLGKGIKELRKTTDELKTAFESEVNAVQDDVKRELDPIREAATIDSAWDVGRSAPPKKKTGTDEGSPLGD